LISIPNLQPDSLGISKKELHQLLEDQELNGIPMLVIGNKVDIKPHLNEKEIIEGLNLDYIYSNEWLVVLTSALKSININSVVDWLLKRSAKH
jgi:GTPase SAR1 family protein